MNGMMQISFTKDDPETQFELNYGLFSKTLKIGNIKYMHVQEIYYRPYCKGQLSTSDTRCPHISYVRCPHKCDTLIDQWPLKPYKNTNCCATNSTNRVPVYPSAIGHS